MNPLFKLVFTAIPFSLLPLFPLTVSQSDTEINVATNSCLDDQNPVFFPDGKSIVSSERNGNKDNLHTRTMDIPESLLLPWNSINDFIYQLQNINLTVIGNTKFDLVIIDYSTDGSESGRFTAEQINILQYSPGGPKLVLAYMSIGEAENYRWYWNNNWDADNDGLPDEGAPSWLGPSNPDWSGNYKVKYWEPEWQSIIYGSSTSYLDKIIETGFDGVYLDIVDAYEYWGPDGKSGQNRESSEQEMVDFISDISAYAKGMNSNFGIFPQNGAALGTHEAYLNAVTGIGQEDIYYGYDGDGQRTPRYITKELEGYLDIFKEAGKLVLTIDYPFSCSEDEPCFDKITRKKTDRAYKKSSKKGYIPYCTVRNLDYLTINPRHRPD